MSGTTVEELQTELAEVKTALQDIRKAGQNYNRPGLGVGRAAYRDLLEHKRELERQIRRMTGSGSMIASDFSGGAGAADKDWGD